MNGDAMNTAATTDPIEPVRLPEVPKRRRWLSVLLGIVIFVSGLAVGGGATFIVLRNRVLQAIRHPEAEPARIADTLRHRLDLTPQQTSQVEEIVRAREGALLKIRRDVQPRVVVELDLVEEQVAGVLNDRQREKWHKLFSELRATWLPPPASANETATAEDAPGRTKP
jgi:hypothetical protein